MNRIGFRMSGDMDQRHPEFDREYRTDAGHRGMDEMAYRGGERMSGHGSGSGGRPFDREMAQEWVSAPVIKCKKTPRKKCSLVAEVKGKR